jgi:dTDP-4-dehydrorhamnose reductase
MEMGTFPQGAILITGTSGFLGSRAAVACQKCGPVICPEHGELEITRTEATLKAFKQYRPRGVIHCAAISDTGYAEAHPSQAYEVNVRGAENVAAACREVGAKLVFMSTDQVYNGCKTTGPLREDCSLAPETVYAEQKLLCEERVAKILPSAVGLRLTWMYGVPGEPGKNAGLLMQLQAGEKKGRLLKYARREFRGLTYVEAVANQLPAMLSLPGGIYNCGAAGEKDTYTVALLAARMMGLPHPEKWILPDESRYQNHPRNLMMDTAKLAGCGICFADTISGMETALGGGRGEKMKTGRGRSL